MRTLGCPEPDARDQRIDAVDDASLPSWTGTAGRAPGRLPPRSASTRSTSNPRLRGRPLQAAQGGRAAARGGHVDVGLGGQGGGERLGEDAVVVDDQDTDANH